MSIEYCLITVKYQSAPFFPGRIMEAPSAAAGAGLKRRREDEEHNAQSGNLLKKCLPKAISDTVSM